MKSYQRNNCRNILLETLKVGGMLTIVFVAPGAAPALLKPFMNNGKYNKPKLKDTLRYMEKNELVGLSSDKSSVTLTLKKKGRDKALKYNIDEMTISKPKKWDKKWRIVIFDIPEKHKIARHVLKNKLDELGFKQIQKSVYLHPYPCENEIEMIRSVYEIRPYVKILTATDIEEESKLKKYYQL
ncbi:MAG: hypothetical protein PHU86_03215 [Patescibacteria group bacterium]|nr:hypothetical protein [Patescibacteria group bacterium]